MKIVVTESQYKKLLKEEEKEQEVLHIPSMKFFNNNWNLLQKFLELKGNPPYTIGGSLDLEFKSIESLGNLTSVGGDLDLRYTPIESLENLESVGGDLYLYDTPLSEKYTEEEIRQMVDVAGEIHLKL